MLQLLNHLYVTVIELTKSNPVLGGVVSLWGLGVVTYACRSVPKTIWDFLSRQATTTATILSSNEVYYSLLRWVSHNKMHSFVRTLTFNNSTRWGGGDSMISMGYGRQFFFHRGRLICMTRKQQDANQTAETKEEVTLTVLGRNHGLFFDLFKTVREESENAGEHITLFHWKDNYWRELCRQYKRKIETVAIPRVDREELLGHIQRFLGNKTWCLSNGIPWRTGILLSGPPGTGKTTLIRAISSHLNKNLYILNLAAMGDENLRDALSSVPEGSVVAIEDIDATNFGIRQIDKKAQNETITAPNAPKTPADKPIVSTYLTLSGLLNAIDGVASGEGRILIATTNCPETLDPALVREGRFDLKMNVGYMTNETFRYYMGRLYSGLGGLVEWHVKPEIAPCSVQALILRYRDDPEAVLERVATKRDPSFHIIEQPNLDLIN